MHQIPFTSISISHDTIPILQILYIKFARVLYICIIFYTTYFLSDHHNFFTVWLKNSYCSLLYLYNLLFIIREIFQVSL